MVHLEVAVRSVSHLALLAVGLAVGVATAEAAGTITGLALPAQGTAGKPFPLTIQGSGTCGRITVDWHTQDGQPPEPLDNKGLPLTYPHTYASPGTYNLVVRAATSDCQGGTKTATVKIVAPPPRGPTSIRSTVPLGVESAVRAGVVRGITTNPGDTIRPNQPVVARVTGANPSAFMAAQSGPCEVFVDWGDGDPRTPLKGSFPMATPPHRYPNHREQGYTITAEGRGSCEGKVSTLLRVVNPPLATGHSGKQLTVLEEAVTPPPVIKTIIPRTPARDLGCTSGVNVPGARLLLVGANFGTRRGEVRLAGSFPGGAPALESLSWTDTEIEGTIPAIRGAFDQKARLQVSRPGGKSSNQYEIAFTAARERVRLPFSALQRVSCDTRTGKKNDCEAIYYATVAARHYGETLDGNTGTDTYEFALKNGWQYDGSEWAPVKDNPTGVQGGPWGSQRCASNVRVSVNWFYDAGFDSAHYILSLYAVGPAGMDPY